MAAAPREEGAQPDRGGPGPRRRVRSARRAGLRGRGPRGPLLPSTVPAWHTRAERFDGLVLAALDPIDRHWHERLGQLDIAVDEVPPVRAGDLSDALHHDSVWPREVVAEGAVPLSRLVPAGVDGRGDSTRARIVLFRRPLELRAEQPEELADLLHEVLVEQVATYLGVDVGVIDPDHPGAADPDVTDPDEA